MTIGDQPAFPKDGSPYGYTGMTYRQALIKEMAGGIMANPDAWRRFNPDELTHEVFAFADAIIKRLEEK